MQSCTKCGYMNKDTDTFCMECGNLLLSGGQKCSYCGANMTAGNRFCNKCGRPAGRTCSTCGNQLKDTESFCRICGTPAASAPLTPAVPVTSPAMRPVSSVQMAPQQKPYPPAPVQTYTNQRPMPAPRANTAYSTPGMPRYTPLTFIMYGVSLIYILAAVIPTYEIEIPFYGKVDSNISILSAVGLGDLGLGLKFVQWFHIFCLMFFIAAFALNIVSLVNVIRHKDRSFWLTMAFSAIIAFVGIMIWVIEWAIILAVLSTNYITGFLAAAINPTFYLYLTIITALFMIIFSFIRRSKSRNY